MRRTTTLTVAYGFEFSRETVFDAWLDSDSVGEWLFATPSGEVVSVELDPRVDGSYRIVDRRGSDEVAHSGEYLKIQRPSRLKFTFKVLKYSDDTTTVTIDLRTTPVGCDLLLTHDGVYEEFLEATRAGWINILMSLNRMLRDKLSQVESSRPGSVI